MNLVWADVSIPHRYGKNRGTAFCPALFLLVSIPHRYGKNFEIGTKLYGWGQVSIPHRYGKNVSGNYARFPFLIGTVRTGN